MAPASDHGSVSRREFIGSTALGSAGLALGISAYFTDSKKRGPDFIALSARREQWVKMGFIGVGHRGSSLLRTALQVPNAVPVAVADVQPGKRKDQARNARRQMRQTLQDESFQVAAYSDYRRLLDDKEVEAVVIATPHYLHGPMAIDAIEAGKHVYCEKAMAFTIGENQDIYNLVSSGKKSADGRSLVFQVGHQRHYSPLYRRVRDMVQLEKPGGDHIGDIAAIRGQWNLNDEIRRPAPDPEMEKVINWRLYSEMSGGLTTEFATHQIDVVNWLLGTHPDSVCGYGGVDWYGADGRDTHDNIHLIFNYKVPVVSRDVYGRVKRDGEQKAFYLTQDGRETTDHRRARKRNTRFTYMSIMENEHQKFYEEILGKYGTIRATLGGGEFFKEKKSRSDPYRIAEGTNPSRAKQKDILKSGATVTPGALVHETGEPIDEALEDRRHWTHYIRPIGGIAYDKVETLLAMESFTECIRLSREGKDFSHELSANVEIGMWSAVPALMANIAMREQRTVYWREFFGSPA